LFIVTATSCFVLPGAIRKGLPDELSNKATNNGNPMEFERSSSWHGQLLIYNG
jgi:hypothetical protein